MFSTPVWAIELFLGREGGWVGRNIPTCNLNRLGCDFYKETVGFALGLAKIAADTNVLKISQA